MFEKMTEIVDFTMKVKEEIKDEEVVCTILSAAASYISKEYMLLVPNEKNIRDAMSFRNFDGAQVFMKESYEQLYEFGIYEALVDCPTTEKAIQLFKDNAIIIVEDEEVMKDFNETNLVIEELTEQTERYFTRRNKAFVGWKRLSEHIRRISKFWEKQTSEDNIKIEGIGFATQVNVAIKIISPLKIESLFNLYTDKEVFHEISSQFLNYFVVDNPFARYKKFLSELTAYVENGNVLSGYDNQNPYFANKTGVFLKTCEHKRGLKNVVWTEMRIEVPYMDFMNIIKDYYFNKMIG